jgi:CubicO group peptidase (beta-lactamase class C family)
MTDLDLLFLHRHVDRLLAPWDRTGTPGVTLGIVRDNHLVLHRSAGMASLELGVPVGPDTTFRIASVSKQFTCAAILLLAAEGRLSIDDDVREHIPALPDLGHRITLSHLMHNTSGIRDMLEIMRCGGADLSQPCTPQDLLDGVCRQRALNFAPGTRYLYSNSNFMLLGRIVEQVSGEALRAFLDRRIFAPLGMAATRHVPSTSEPVPGLASGYLAAPGGGWQRAMHGFPLHGEGGLVSSVPDLALWHANFASPRVGGGKLAEALTTQTPFANGQPNAYARGLGVRCYRGQRIVEHGGLWPGFKTAFLRLPDYAAAVICITNNATVDPHALAQAAVDVMLDGDATAPKPPPALPHAALAGLAGRWLDRAAGATADIAVAADGTVTVTTYGVPFVAAPAEDGRLAAAASTSAFALRLSADRDVLEVERDAGVRSDYRRVAEGAALPEGLDGVYENPDTAATWSIGAGEVRVIGPLVRGGAWSAEPIEADVIRIVAPGNLYRSWFDVRVLRDASGQISGLRADGGRAKGLVFTRCG